MSIVQGNDRILFVKVGDIFQPIACLSNNGMSEDVETISTTTRNSEGWRTSLPTQQGFSVTFEGFQVPTLFRANTDSIVNTVITVTLQNNSTSSPLKFTIIGTDWVFFINKFITNDTDLITATPSFYILAGSTIAETVTNIVTNLNIYNATPKIAYLAVGDSIILQMLENDEFQISVLDPSAFPGTPIIATAEIERTIVNNPSNLVSYDRLRLFKRERRFLTFRIMNTEPLPQFIDEFDGYITQISESSPVNEDATFSGTITGWGVPRVIVNDIGLAAGDDFVEDGNDNIIEP